MDEQKLSSTERIKTQSDGLRGTIIQSLAGEVSGALLDDDQALIKFHGMYQQDDRDRREERAAKMLDRLYSFMIRLRLPGGFMTAEQWVATHHIAGNHSTGIIKITTRQTLQLHGLVKSHIRPTIQAFNEASLDSIATCGDINRNVVCSSHPGQSPLHAQIFSYAGKISTMLLPKTGAYYDIWIGDEKIHERKDETDPLYQDRYLPRKFKIAIGIPPNNDVDVLANDIGLIAIIENDELKGFNIAIGGGLSSTHGNPENYARLATVIGFNGSEEQTLKIVYEILTIQRDYGNRSDRKLARLKYTIDRLGLDWFKKELEQRVGFALEPARPYVFTERKDYYGWQQNHEGKWFYTAFIENGRVLDEEGLQLKTAFYEIALSGKAAFRFTCNQNLILSDITNEDKPFISDILHRYGVLRHTDEAGNARKNAMACVALNTCPLALAEGQRYLPLLITKIEAILDKYHLAGEDIIIRMTGCPNGCARPVLAEIGFIGTAPGRYNLMLGADLEGTRLNRLYKEHLDESAILNELDQLLKQYSLEKNPGEHFGDFSLRKQWV